MKKKPMPARSIRFTPEDNKLVLALRAKLGVELSQIVRLGLRALATKEGVTA